MLEIACGVTKNKFPDLETIIGIASDPPKSSKLISEDFILMDCRDWTNDKEEYYRSENINTGMNFYETKNLKMNKTHTQEYPNTSIVIES